MEFYTTREIARMLRVEVITVERWLARGKLRGVKVGRQWLVTQDDLEDFVYATLDRRENDYGR